MAGGPALRRTFLNGALAQLSPAYYRDLARYGKIVQQKAALLRGAIAPDRELLLAYNEELLAPAAGLMTARAAFVGEIAAAAEQLQDAFLGNEFHPALQGLPREEKEKVGDFLTKLDVLTGFERLAIVTGYRVGGEPAGFGAAGEPGLTLDLEWYDGWNDDLTGVRRVDDLPASARRYVGALAESFGVPVDAVSVGAERSALAVA